MQRAVRPELLDSLPHDHPEALQNRQELRTINALMGNHRWLERQARRRLPAGTKALEIGAGSGELARRLRRSQSPVQLDGLDLCPAPSDWDAGRRWWREDLTQFDGYAAYDAVFANLILHQFDNQTLTEIGRRIRATARFLFASEPARRRRHIAQFKAVAAVGKMGKVSRHDGVVSIRAGFLGEELPHLLGLDRETWKWECRCGWRGQYFMTACRRKRS